MSIAIIEDDANIRNLIKIVLSDLNVPIDEYDNGWRGLDGVTQKKYSLLVLDLMLPGVNGMEICRKIRQSNNTMPILMLTSKSEEDDKIAGLETGADDYLTKPFSNRELLARVKALLRRSVIKSEIDKEIRPLSKGIISGSDKSQITINVAKENLSRLPYSENVKFDIPTDIRQGYDCRSEPNTEESFDQIFDLE